MSEMAAGQTLSHGELSQRTSSDIYIRKNKMSEQIRKKLPGRPFQKGNQIAKGHKGGSGRPPDWFKRKMAELACSEAAINLVEGAIKGKPIDEFLVLQTGVQVPVKPDAATRLKYLAFAADRGGFPSIQKLEHSGTVTLEQLVSGSKEDDK